MRLSRWQGKEIINLYDGARFGLVGEADLEVDEASGTIQGIIFHERGGFFGQRKEVRIPWGAVRRVGPELIIVDWNPRGKEWGTSRNKTEEREAPGLPQRSLEAASWQPEAQTRKATFLHRVESKGKE